MKILQVKQVSLPSGAMSLFKYLSRGFTINVFHMYKTFIARDLSFGIRNRPKFVAGGFIQKIVSSNVKHDDRITSFNDIKQFLVGAINLFSGIWQFVFA